MCPNPEPELTTTCGKKSYQYLSGKQYTILRKIFSENPHPNVALRIKLSKLLNLDKAKVDNWFKRKRSKCKIPQSQ